jgi:hypothetical protein
MMIPSVRAALCSARQPFAGLVDEAPDRNIKILNRISIKDKFLW